jgi:hypothetical protein
VKKPDGAGCSELAVDFRVAARKAIAAKIKLMLHAHHLGFPVRVVDAFGHGVFFPVRPPHQCAAPGFLQNFAHHNMAGIAFE